jgi:hypothetical protein
MKNSTLLAVGFFGGAVIGGGFTFLELAPKAAAFLMAPLKWLTEGLNGPYPRESVGNIFIAFPLMFVYWGCLGVLLCFLLRYFFRLLRGHSNA